MTSRLIPVFGGTIISETVLLYNARDLHAFLGVKRVLVAWITNRILKYKFIENQDYILLSNLGKQTPGRSDHNRKDYHLTLDTTKELAMVGRNEEGHQIHRYFIECEKKLRSMQPAQQFTNGEITSPCCVRVQTENAQDICKPLYPIMKKLNSSYASKLYDIVFEAFHAAMRNRDVLPREAI